MKGNIQSTENYLEKKLTLNHFKKKDEWVFFFFMFQRQALSYSDTNWAFILNDTFCRGKYSRSMDIIGGLVWVFLRHCCASEFISLQGRIHKFSGSNQVPRNGFTFQIQQVGLIKHHDNLLICNIEYDLLLNRIEKNT